MNRRDETEAADTLELLAYADGRLDACPARRRALEAALAKRPEAAAHARAWRAQTAALRRAFGALDTGPTPERFVAALAKPPEHRAKTPLRAAAAATLIAAASALGWVAGREAGVADGAPRDFVAATLAHAPGPEQAGAAAAAAAATGGQVANLAGALAPPAPDLSRFGLSLARMDALGTSDGPVTRLTYRDASGEAVALFLRPRRRDGVNRIAMAERDGVALAHWEDGPFSTALAARRPIDETRALARAVRGAMAAAPAPQTAEADAPPIPAPLPVNEAPVGPRGAEPALETLAPG